MKNPLKIFFLFLLFQSAAAFADVKSDSIVLSTIVKPDFKPINAVFIVTLNGSQTIAQQALLSEVDPSDEEENNWIVATVLKNSGIVNDLKYRVILNGKVNQYQIMDFPLETTADVKLRQIGLSQLKDRQLLASQKIDDWKAKIKSGETEVIRLRKDAEVIGNLGRITQLIEDNKLLKEQVREGQNNIERLQTFLDQASEQQDPRNFVRRQSELTAQLEELARLVQSVEEGESERTSMVELEHQRKLALIEETRYASELELQQQLDTLKRSRESLEKELGIESGRVVEDYLAW